MSHVTESLTEPHTGDRGSGESPSRALRPVPGWKSLVAIVVLGGALGGLVGAIRTPNHTAVVDVALGTGGLEASSVPGYAQAVQSLAASYARTIRARSVTDVVARDVGASSDGVAKRLSASPIPDSSVIRVEASAASSALTVRLANAGATAFAADVSRRIDGASRKLLPIEDVEAAQLSVLRARRTLSRLRAVGTSETSNDYLAALAALSARQTKARVVNSQYEQSRNLTSVLGISVVRPATDAASDRRSKFILFVMLGLLLGGVLAIAVGGLKNMRANSERRR